MSARIFLRRLAAAAAIICISAQLSFAEYSGKEVAAIGKLRTAMKDKLTHNFMMTDEYLMRWLTAKRMDVKQAQQMLEASLKWRKENNIDQILTEDFSIFEKQYPINSFGVDKEGRPIIGVSLGQWNFRKAAQSGQYPQLLRYLIKVGLEEPRMTAEKLANSTGISDTKYILLEDLNGFNLKEHVCLQCLSIYTQFITIYERNYPESFYKLLIVNAPTIFETIMDLVRPIMSPASKRDFIIQGVRKADWVPVIHKYVDPDQIPPQFGGNKKFKG